MASIEHILPIPVYIHDADENTFNTIKSEIQNHQKIIKKLSNTHTWGDLVTTTFVQCRNIALELNLQHLQNFLTEHISSFLNYLNFQNPVYVSESWFNSFVKGGMQDWHIHTSSHNGVGKNVLSGVYYYDGNYNEKDGSVIQLSPFYGSTSSPLLTQNANYNFEKQGGRLVIFSSALPHRVPYFKGKRNSFTFNVSLTV
jgi:hypothetical protein